MASASSSLLCAPRWATPRTPERVTLGERAALLAERLGIELMPWQRLVLEVGLELEWSDRHELWLPAYPEVTVTVPRQSGKTTAVVVKKATRVLAWPNRRRQSLAYGAQTRQDAREKWEEHVELLRATLLRALFTVRLSNGSEKMRWRGGHTWAVLGGRRSISGHGKTLDDVDLDEFFAQRDFAIEQAIRPTMLTRLDSQLWRWSTMGDESAVPLNTVVAIGRARVEAGMNRGIAYFEWSAADGADPADPATWWSCMPALGYTQTEDKVRLEFEALADRPGEFERAYLNRRTVVTETVIPLTAWAEAVDVRATHGGRVFLATDVAQDRTHAAIAAASIDAAGRAFVEITDYRPGTRWIVPRLVELEAKWRPDAIVIDGGGPARSKLADLLDALPDPNVVRVIGAQEVAAAAGEFLEAVLGGHLAHLDQPELNMAVAGAAKRTLLDTWAWARRSSAVDIAPLVAATHAHWAARTPPVRGFVG